MPNLSNPIPEELYVIEVDGIRRSEHRIFFKALKRALELSDSIHVAMSNCAMHTRIRNTTGLPCPNERGALVEDSPVHGPSKRVMDAFPG